MHEPRSITVLLTIEAYARASLRACIHPTRRTNRKGGRGGDDASLQPEDILFSTRQRGKSVGWLRRDLRTDASVFDRWREFEIFVREFISLQDMILVRKNILKRGIIRGRWWHRDEEIGRESYSSAFSEEICWNRK